MFGNFESHTRIKEIPQEKFKELGPLCNFTVLTVAGMNASDTEFSDIVAEGENFEQGYLSTIEFQVLSADILFQLCGQRGQLCLPRTKFMLSRTNLVRKTPIGNPCAKASVSYYETVR